MEITITNFFDLSAALFGIWAALMLIYRELKEIRKGK